MEAIIELAATHFSWFTSHGVVELIGSVFATARVGREVGNLLIAIIREVAHRTGVRGWLTAHPGVARVVDVAAGEVLTPEQS